MTSLAGKVVRLHEALTGAGFDHAFGGALALAWCTKRARGTIDIDLNVFAAAGDAEQILAALPPGVRRSEHDVERCREDGQVRLWWGETPIDIFASTTEFHEGAADRALSHRFAGQSVPFLCCDDLAVFKAFFDRTRDWADIEEMISAGTLDANHALGALVRYLATDDDRVRRLRGLVRPPDGRP